MSFNTIQDFTGETNISQNKYTKIDYENIITSTEERILKDLLGEDLYLKLIATPAVAPYLELVNGTTYAVVNEDGVTVNVNYQGIKKMLKYFTYVEILRFQKSENTEVGQVDPQQNNSVRLPENNLSKKIMDSYNKGIDLYGFDIQTYGNSKSLIRGMETNITKNTEYDYYRLYVKGSCFNYLWYEYENYPTRFPTWQFTCKELSFINGYL